MAPFRATCARFRGKPVYVTLDIDAVTRRRSGTGTPQVGGLTSAQILDLVRPCAGLNIVGCRSCGSLATV